MNLDADTLRILGIVKDSFFPMLIAGLKFTIPVAVVSFVLGSIVAMATALARISKYKSLNLISSFYVWIIRGTPLLVQLFIIFYRITSGWYNNRSTTRCNYRFYFKCWGL